MPVRISCSTLRMGVYDGGVHVRSSTSESQKARSNTSLILVCTSFSSDWPAYGTREHIVQSIRGMRG
jgi:hypothetical protein